MGTGTTVWGKGICKSVVVALLGLTVKEDFLSLGLRSIDLILGMQWLRTLGMTVVDWKNLTLTIGTDLNKVVIKSDPTLMRREVSLKSLSKSWD